MLWLPHHSRALNIGKSSWQFSYLQLSCYRLHFNKKKISRTHPTPLPLQPNTSLPPKPASHLFLLNLHHTPSSPICPIPLPPQLTIHPFLFNLPHPFLPNPPQTPSYLTRTTSLPFQLTIYIHSPPSSPTHYTPLSSPTHYSLYTLILSKTLYILFLPDPLYTFFLPNYPIPFASNQIHFYNTSLYIIIVYKILVSLS